MDLKQQIIQHIHQKEYQAKTNEELAAFFNVPTKEINRLAKEIIDEGKGVLSKKSKLISLKMANMLVGTIMINAKGFGFLVNDESDEDIFIPTPYVKSAMHKDVVIVVKHTDKNEVVGEVVSIIKRAKTQVVGTVKIKNKKAYLASLDTRIDD